MNIKIYIPPPPPPSKELVRINIRKRSHTPKHITVEGCTAQECRNFLQEVMRVAILELIQSGKFDPLTRGERTLIEAREAVGGTNGKTVSFVIYGIDPVDVEGFIIKALTPPDVERK